MTLTAVIECLDCGWETDHHLTVGRLDFIVCPVCLCHHIVFRHFYVLDDSHIVRKNKRVFVCDMTLEMRKTKKPSPL